MKGLSYTEKQRKYQILKDDVRKRLHSSYINCHQKLDFYRDTFEVLGLYDAEYIVSNLFFERNAEQIIDTLLKQNFFKKINISFHRSNTLAFDFYYFMIDKPYFMTLEFNDFLRDKTFDVVQTLTHQQWTNNITTSHPIVNEYATFLTHVDPKEKELGVYGYFLFVKIWNYFSIYSSPFNNTKAIKLYNEFIIFFNKNDYGSFYNFFIQLENKFNSFFVQPEYLPLLDKKDCDSYSNGYIKKKEQFFDFIKFQGKVNSISSQMSYFELIETCDDNLIEIIELNISEKTNSFCYPDNNELLQLEGLRKDNNLLPDILDRLFQKLYLY